jgi:hypothetical protein
VRLARHTDQIPWPAGVTYGDWAELSAIGDSQYFGSGSRLERKEGEGVSTLQPPGDLIFLGVCGGVQSHETNAPRWRHVLVLEDRGEPESHC